MLRYGLILSLAVAGLCSTQKLSAQGFSGGGNAGLSGGGGGSSSSSGGSSAFGSSGGSAFGTSGSSFATAGFGDGSFASSGFSGSSTGGANSVGGGLVGTLSGNQTSMFGRTAAGTRTNQTGGGNRTSTTGGGTTNRAGGQNASSTARRRGSTTQSGQGQAGASGQVWFEPRIEVGFSTPVPVVSVVTANLTNIMHGQTLASRFGGVQITVEGGMAILRGTVSSPDDRQLAEQLALLEPTISSVRNEVNVGPPPAAVPPPAGPANAR